MQCFTVYFCRAVTLRKKGAYTSGTGGGMHGLPVNSSLGHLVTSQLVTRVSSQSQLVTSEHKKAIPVAIFFIYLDADQVAPINSAEHGRRNYSKRVCTRHTQWCAVWFAYLGLTCVISKSPMMVKLLNATNARSKSTVNSSQRLQTGQSTHHTILRCDELTVCRVDWFPMHVGNPMCRHKVVDVGKLVTSCAGWFSV